MVPTFITTQTALKDLVVELVEEGVATVVEAVDQV